MTWLLIRLIVSIAAGIMGWLWGLMLSGFAPNSAQAAKQAEGFGAVAAVFVFIVMTLGWDALAWLGRHLR